MVKTCQNHPVIDSGLDEISLSVPAHIAYARIVRLAAASLALNQGMSFSEIDDLRNVVDEAVGVLLATDGGESNGSLDIIYRFSAGRFELEGSRSGSGTFSEESISRFTEQCASMIDEYEFRAELRWLRFRKTPAGDT